MNNISTGKKGEDLAQEYLIKKGYKILETNKRFSRLCEIDIIAKDKNSESIDKIGKLPPVS